MSSKLKICDSDIQKIEELIRIWNSYDEIYCKYLELLSELKDTGITEGKIHDALDCLYQYSLGNQQQLQGLGNKVTNMSRIFLNEVDACDGVIY